MTEIRSHLISIWPFKEAPPGGVPNHAITQIFFCFQAFTQWEDNLSFHANYRKNWYENGSFHAITQTYGGHDIHTFTMSSVFHIYTVSVSLIPQSLWEHSCWDGLRVSSNYIPPTYNDNHRIFYEVGLGVSIWLPSVLMLSPYNVHIPNFAHFRAFVHKDERKMQ